MRLFLGVLLCVCGVVSAQAELRLATLFSEGMVLQRGEEVPVWGWADAGETVTVEFAGQTRTGVCDSAGRFSVELAPMSASREPQVLKVRAGDESLCVEQVLVGEVWLCSGQSNMAWPVSKANNFEEEKAAANYPLIRMFMTELKGNRELQDDCSGQWVRVSPQTVGPLSATAYFFGRELFKELDVPVGLIRSCWGATRIEAWMPMELLREDPTAMEIKRAQDQRAMGFDAEREERLFVERLEAYEKKLRRKKKKGGTMPFYPQRALHPHESKFYPANLYNAMIHPLIPYGIRGAIWYQGEANAKKLHDARGYADRLEKMVGWWRQQWGSEFPFYAVQLVNFRQPVETAVEDHPWSFMREAVFKFQQNVPKTGMAVGIDAGERATIHPPNKQAIGQRLARQALAKTYGRSLPADGPHYRSMEKEKGRIVISFDHVGSGLKAEGGALKWFAIAGEDRRFKRAQAEIVGETVVVSSPEVPKPVAVRYAWANNPEGCNLYNQEGLPASPFRTDDWPPKR